MVETNVKSTGLLKRTRGSLLRDQYFMTGKNKSIGPLLSFAKWPGCMSITRFNHKKAQLKMNFHT